jgi:hypothetical protein
MVVLIRWTVMWVFGGELSRYWQHGILISIRHVRLVSRTIRVPVNSLLICVVLSYCLVWGSVVENLS